MSVTPVIKTVGCVPYQNAKPLIWWMERCANPIPAEVLFEEPSQLPRMLYTGQIDAMLTSSYEALKTDGLKIVNSASISSYQEVGSVKIFSKVPPESIKSLALDQSSLTSIHLAQIILRERYGAAPKVQYLPPDLSSMLQKTDAAVIIGDRCIHAQCADLYKLDLGAEWNKLTGKPFVWALWMGQDHLDAQLASVLVQSKEWGLRNLKQIIPVISKQKGWSLEFCSHYYQKNLNFDFTEEHLEGLLLFREYLLKHSFLQESRLPEVLEIAKRALVY